ncbi:Nuclear distribution protein nudE-like 1 [Trichoplax sp. H2]|nr:Nuclear distribution protein nudE-like 1 [Trichoplax sp. H2]|eukprot:RDD43869.1 Nuclear distribution protein nudE-like 1 [Trichoplax sp. H2]
METTQLAFTDSVQEINYWKSIANEANQTVQQLKDELEEFQEESHDLEAELEAQLKQAENRAKDLTITKAKLEQENEVLKEKFDTLYKESYQVTTRLQDELATANSTKEELQKHSRKLEQKNDDYERAERSTAVTLQDFENRLNQALEKNALLENELDEKEKLVILVQRLKDECKELKEEFTARQVTAVDTKDVATSPIREVAGSDYIISPFKFSVSSSPRNRSYNRNGAASPRDIVDYGKKISNQDSNLPVNARVNAMNIVGDLLKKVGDLESKLSSCRNLVKEQVRFNKIENDINVYANT